MDEKSPVGEIGNNVDGINGELADIVDGSNEVTKTAEVEVLEMADASCTSAGDARETRCGLGSWRPAYLRPFGTIWSFTAAVSMLWATAGITFTYYSAVIPQIERRFGLSSSMSGFIRNVDNVGYMLVILAVSHLGRYANKPRILAVSSLLSAVSVLLFAAPHFVYGGGGGGLGRYGHLPVGSSNASTAAERGSRRARYELCDGVDRTTAEPDDCGGGSTSLYELNEGAVALFIVSQLLLGVALSPTSSLTMTYMDDNARDQSPKYFGLTKLRNRLLIRSLL